MYQTTFVAEIIFGKKPFKTQDKLLIYHYLRKKLLK